MTYSAGPTRYSGQPSVNNPGARYRNGIGRVPTTTSITSSTTSVTLLAANANRRGLSIYNDSTGMLRVSFSTPATSANAFVGIAAGGFLLLDPQLIGTGPIYGIWSSANGTAQVTEWI